MSTLAIDIGGTKFTMAIFDDADRMIARGGDPVGVRKAFTIAGFLMASTEVVGALSDSVPVALFFAVFSLSGLGLATANYWALTQTLIPGGAIGRIVGIQNCAANLPGIVVDRAARFRRNDRDNIARATADEAASRGPRI